MASIPYMQLYMADFLADTAHLDGLESGAYLLLMVNYYQRGKAIPNNDKRLAMIAKVTPEQWQQIKPTILEFFEEQDGLLYNYRIESELEKVREKSVKASNAGKESAKRRIKDQAKGKKLTLNKSQTDKEQTLNDKPAEQEQAVNVRSADVQQAFNHTDTNTDTDTDTNTDTDTDTDTEGGETPPPPDGPQGEANQPEKPNDEYIITPEYQVFKEIIEILGENDLQFTRSRFLRLRNLSGNVKIRRAGVIQAAKNFMQDQYYSGFIRKYDYLYNQERIEKTVDLITGFMASNPGKGKKANDSGEIRDISGDIERQVAEYMENRR